MINKVFPGVRALDKVSLRAEGGRVLALLGENGAGKSTLLKIIAGDLHADSGEITLNGAKQHYSSPFNAIKAGVSVIYQERQMIPAMSVMENIFAGALPRGKLGLIDHAKLRRDAQEIIDKFKLPIDPRTPVGKLSVAYQQMVEIMKAYRRNSLVIAFDEPTSSLTETETVILFEIIEQMKQEGKIIIYVSHRIAEIFRITDDIVVLKDGRVSGNFTTSQVTESELIQAMVGRDIGDTYADLRRSDAHGDTLLEVKNLVTGKIYDVSFSVRKGEVIGFAGLVGAGRTEVVRAVFAADPIESGEIIFEGEPVDFKTPKDAIDAGVALCPEDRKEQGLVLPRSIRDNVSITVLEKVIKRFFLDNREEDVLAEDAIRKYGIKTPDADKRVMELSGGNQQKVILGRWTNNKMHTKLLILDEPTKGIDVGTKAEIYQMVCDFARQGIGVIFISSELTEVINVADTIYVMRNGRITGRLARAEATEESVLALAMTEKEAL